MITMEYDTVAAYPKSAVYLKDRLYIYCEIESVALPGPPFVMFMTSSKSWSVPIVDVIDVNRMIGFSIGIVIFVNCLNDDAPSIRAAS
ncbi:hypothetical protein D3C77_518580 [compost metagenome]